MSNQEILEKAIQKAIEGGWLPHGRDPEHPAFISDLTLEGVDKCYILSKGFAKALWGDEGFTTTGLKCSKHPGVSRYWQYQLQQMVIADDPVQYLGENL